jgi:hypothetical protein
MQRYSSYQASLDELLAKARWGRRRVSDDEIHPHLNGGAAAQLKELVSRAQIRRAGAFFTGEELGRSLVGKISRDHPETAAWDPSCGAGDLLLRWSERLPVFGDLRETLHHWGERLHGQDIHLEFLMVAKRRLTLAAISRGACLKRGALSSFDDWFPNLQQRSLLRGRSHVPSESVILMNPLFTMIATPPQCRDWSSGRVSFAAVALLKCVMAASDGQRISAILPDVLRSGSRYEHWRKKVAQHLQSFSIEIVGRFGEQADVDVFVLNAVVGTAPQSEISWTPSESSECCRTLESICEVRVGTVVPHRHKPKGRPVPYLTTGEAVAWGEMDCVRTRLRFTGTCVTGPFLAIRRTSSPSDGSRAISTVVASVQRVALENHLISVRPLDGSAETCRGLSAYLQSNTVRRWLDQRIRCRHLTVSAIKQLPIPACL